MRLRILSWNVNGLRRLLAAYGSLEKLLADLGSDIVCFQEHKLKRGDLERELALVDGWDSFFAFTRGKTGYSGVVTFVRRGTAGVPVAAEEGLTGVLALPLGSRATGTEHQVHPRWSQEGWGVDELRALDAEGRCVLTDHGAFVLANVYVPAITNEETAEERFAYKLRFLRALQLRLDEHLSAGRRVVLLGDLNIAPAHRDRCGATPKDFDYRRPDRRWLWGLLRRGQADAGGPGRLGGGGAGASNAASGSGGFSEAAGQGGAWGAGGQTKAELPDGGGAAGSSGRGATAQLGVRLGCGWAAAEAADAAEGPGPSGRSKWPSPERSWEAWREPGDGGSADEGMPRAEEEEGEEGEEGWYGGAGWGGGACGGVQAGAGREAGPDAAAPLPAFCDTFRAFHPDRVHAYTCWNVCSNARVNNYGSRIDLVLAADGARGVRGRGGGGAAGGPGAVQGAEAEAGGGGCSGGGGSGGGGEAGTGGGGGQVPAQAGRPCCPPWVVAADTMPDFQGSDHAPVWVDVLLPDAELHGAPCAAAATHGSAPAPQPAPPALASRYLFDSTRQVTLRTVLSRVATPAEAGPSQGVAVRVSQGGSQGSQPAVQRGSQGLQGQQRTSQEQRLGQGQAKPAQRKLTAFLQPKVGAAGGGAGAAGAGGGGAGASSGGAAVLVDLTEASQEARPVGETQADGQAGAEHALGTDLRHAGHGQLLQGEQAGVQQLLEQQQRPQGPGGVGPSAESQGAPGGAPQGLGGNGAPGGAQEAGGRAQAALAWKQIQEQMKPPRCPGHNEPCVIRTVKKRGENNGRQFWCCARADGLPPNGRCDFFQWTRGRTMAGSGTAGAPGASAGRGKGAAPPQKRPKPG